MRISTAMIYQAGGDAIARQQSELMATQQRLSTGQRLLSPADDPAAATQALVVSSAKATNTQYAANIGTARDALSQNEMVLGQATDTLQAIRTLAVNGGSGSLSDADRRNLADQIAGQLADLVGLANSKNADGSYLFSGFAADTKPFVQTGSGIAYLGDQGQRMLDLGSGRTMAISETGEAVFLGGQNGNGTFTTAPAAANSGSGVIDAGSVTDPAQVNGHSYRIAFTSPTQYDLLDVTAGTTTSNAYVAGTAIALPGMQVTLTGAPAATDSFDIKPSTAQSVFATVQSLIDALRTSGTTDAGRARIANGIGEALSNIDQGLGNVLTVRAGLGARLSELDTLASGNDSRGIGYDQTLSGLLDVDYARSMSDFAQQQVTLQAAQQSFVKVSGLSLFDYLR